MRESDLRSLLALLRQGDIEVDDAVERLRRLPFEDLDFAKVDHHRALRRGIGEAIFAEPKPQAELLAIAESMWRQSGSVIATRVTPSQGQSLVDLIPAGSYDGYARTFCARQSPEPSGEPVAVVTAGTADRAVAGEAHNTLVHYGHPVERIDDCGVAGIHRLIEHIDTLVGVSVVIVVAGMEGALPSVVAGLIPTPVIAVPTSVGYGAAFSGLAALLGMLTSCAQGVTVVNIDNGFGAACAAALVARRSVGTSVDTARR